MKIRKIKLLVTALFFITVGRVFAAESGRAGIFAGQDLHLSGEGLVSYQPATGEHALVFDGGFTMSIGSNRFTSDSGVIRLESIAGESPGRVDIDYRVRAYLKGNVSVNRTKGARTTDISESVVENGDSIVVRFTVNGEVFVTAQKREVADPRELELYKEAALKISPLGPDFVVQPGAIVPEFPPAESARVEAERGEVEVAAGPAPTAAAGREADAKAGEPIFRYPVNISPAGEESLEIEWVPGPDGIDVATITERFYIWQKQDEEGGLLELQADSAVIFSSGSREDSEQSAAVSEAGGGGLTDSSLAAIYVTGDVIMTEGRRTIRADEIFYDFEQKKALAINAVMRNFDISRGMPIYVRAAKLRQLTENKFTAEDIVLTSSEFYLPQISTTASSVIITDTTEIDQQQGTLTDNSFEVLMKDVRLKAGDKTVFYWPAIRSNMQRSDVPIKRLHLGQDNTWGTSLESDWYLSRLLGLREPDGVDSTFSLDYFSKRGVGAGFMTDYNRDDYFGRTLGYIINDRGEDRLGREEFRKNVEHPRELRGWFSWRHRHFLPHNWQVTTGIGYSSDENFIESYYRNEYSSGIRDETYVHLKRLEDNWALAFLGKARINDFQDELEELPSGEFHLTGKSLFNDTFTYYGDTELGRLRQRIGNKHTTSMNQESFTFGWHRSELDMPVQAGGFKIVPFVAGLFGYDDRSGFRRTLVDGSNSGSFGESDVLIGEAGLRVSPRPLWKVYPDVKSRLWDLNQLRHVVKPQFTAVAYGESDKVVEQRDVLNLAISQRLQTRRGVGEKSRTVDWMRLDMDLTFVSDPDSADSVGADRFIWNRSTVPMRILSTPKIFSGDFFNSLHRFEMYGPRRNYFGADYIWRASDTTAVLSDMNYDLQSGVVQQYNFGFSRMRWPNLSYYIGSRYLRRIEILGEKGTNVFIFSATYKLDPRYTLAFSQQFDFDYGASVRSDFALIRQYHRMYFGVTFSADQSLDRQAFVISLWPQGVPEMSIGQRKYMKLGEAGDY